MKRLIIIVILILLTILSSCISSLSFKITTKPKNIFATISIALSIITQNPTINNAIDHKDIGTIEVSMENKKVKLKEYFGKKGTLIVNVASQCALTNQYEGRLIDYYC